MDGPAYVCVSREAAVDLDVFERGSVRTQSVYESGGFVEDSSEDK
jgi:hypothetical protein